MQRLLNEDVGWHEAHTCFWQLSLGPIEPRILAGMTIAAQGAKEVEAPYSWYGGSVPFEGNLDCCEES